MAQLGGSGNNGVIPVALTTGMQWGPESIPPNAPYALSRGFVDVRQRFRPSDGRRRGAGGGGRGRTAAAGLDDERRSADELRVRADEEDARRRSGARGGLLRRSRFATAITSASSQGGREALMVAQRFPQDYDGVFAQVPAHAYVHISVGEPLARAKAQAGDGWIPPAKVPVIAKEVLRQCDALDGIEDGLVSNYIACNRKFDPATSPKALDAVRCAGGADTGETCLSDAQIRAANAVHGSINYPFALDKGWTTFAGWPTGSESAANWKTLPARPSVLANFGMLRSRIVRDANANLLDVDLATYAKEIQQLSAVIDADRSGSFEVPAPRRQADHEGEHDRLHGQPALGDGLLRQGRADDGRGAR